MYKSCAFGQKLTYTQHRTCTVTCKLPYIYVYDPLHSLCKGIYNDLILFLNFLEKKTMFVHENVLQRMEREEILLFRRNRCGFNSIQLLEIMFKIPSYCLLKEDGIPGL